MFSKTSVLTVCHYVACLLCLFSAAGQARSEELPADALLAKLKTAYLFNIAKFVSWPEQPTRVVLCIDPSSPIQSYVMQLNDRLLSQSQRLQVVQRVTPQPSCHMFFSNNAEAIGHPAPEHSDVQTLALASSLPTAVSNHVLSISDHPKALDMGYTVHLGFKKDRLRFGFNYPLLSSSTFQVSSKLLALAKKE